jgi:hypothetical protein
LTTVDEADIVIMKLLIQNIIKSCIRVKVVEERPARPTEGVILSGKRTTTGRTSGEIPDFLMRDAEGVKLSGKRTEAAQVY